MSRRRTPWPAIPELDVPGLVNQRLTGAACAGRHPLFDDRIRGEPPEDQEARHHRARAVCAGCPIRNNCATVAHQLPADQRTGIWAGHLWKETA